MTDAAAETDTEASLRDQVESLRKKLRGAIKKGKRLEGELAAARQATLQSNGSDHAEARCQADAAEAGAAEQSSDEAQQQLSQLQEQREQLQARHDEVSAHV